MQVKYIEVPRDILIRSSPMQRNIYLHYNSLRCKIFINFKLISNRGGSFKLGLYTCKYRLRVTRIKQAVNFASNEDPPHAASK